MECSAVYFLKRLAARDLDFDLYFRLRVALVARLRPGCSYGVKELEALMV